MPEKTTNHKITLLYAQYTSILYDHYNEHNIFMQDILEVDHDCIWTVMENFKEKRNVDLYIKS